MVQERKVVLNVERTAEVANNESPHGAKSTLVVCGTAHCVHDGLHDSLYILLPLWSQAFGLSLTQVGMLKFAYSGAMAIFQMPAGFLSERFSPRLLLAIGTSFLGLAFFLLGLTGGFVTLLLLLFFAGLGSGPQHPLSSTLVAKAYETGPRRAALGIYNFSGDIGKVALPAILALVAGAVGWRMGVFGLGVFGVISAAAILIALTRLGAGSRPKSKKASEKTISPSGWGILNRRGFAAISAINLLDTGVTFGFLTFLPFLLIEKGAGVEMVGLAVALVFGGGAAGKFLCGLLAERMGIVRTMVLTEIATGAGILVLLFMPLLGALALLPLVGVAMNGTSSVLYATVADFITPERHARGFAFFYTVGMGAGAISPLIFGLVSDAVGVSTSMVILGVLIFLTIPFCLMVSYSQQPLPKRRDEKSNG
jgi:MFS family permease